MSKIASYLLDVGAVAFSPQKPFTWASGIKSPIYCDNRLLLSHPKALKEVIKGFKKLIKDKKIKVDVVAGVATAGIPYASILAYELKKPLVYVRSKPKDHGKGNQIEGALKKGSRVLVIEDLISTGKSSIAVIEAIEKENSKVVACLSVFSYNFPTASTLFQLRKIALYSLENLSHLIKQAQKKKVLNAKDIQDLERFIKNPTDW